MEQVVDCSKLSLQQDFFKIDKKRETFLLHEMFPNDAHFAQSVQLHFSDYTFLWQMILFISQYTGDDIYHDLVSSMQDIHEMQFVLPFYIYYIYLLCKYDFLSADSSFKEKCKQLFYDGEVELSFGKDAFPLFPSSVDLGTFSVDSEIDSSLLSFVEERIPSTMHDPLELSISLYILLNQYLRYDARFLIYGYQRPVSSDTNDVICVTWSILYYQLLRRYGIEATLVGRFDKHMFVHLKVGSLLIKADGTSFGHDENDFYRMSDLGNCKMGICIRSFQLRENCYSDKERLHFYQRRLERAISTVYQKLQLPCSFGEKLEELSEKVTTTFMSMYSFDRGEIEKRLAAFSSFLPIQDCPVESLQFLKMLMHQFFSDILDGIEVITLFHGDEKTDLLFLLHFEDLEGNHFYYLQTDQGLYPYDIETLVDYLVSHDFHFKNSSDVDALDISTERKLKLV